MLGDIDHALLLSLGLKKAAHRIKIIRHAQLRYTAKKHPAATHLPAPTGDVIRLERAGSRERLRTGHKREESSKVPSAARKDWTTPQHEREPAASTPANTSAATFESSPNTTSVKKEAPATGHPATFESSPNTTSVKKEAPATGHPAVSRGSSRGHEQEQQQRRPPIALHSEDDEVDYESESTTDGWISSESESEGELEGGYAEGEAMAELLAAVNSAKVTAARHKVLPIDSFPAPCHLTTISLVA